LATAISTLLNWEASLLFRALHFTVISIAMTGVTKMSKQITAHEPGELSRFRFVTAVGEFHRYA